MSNRPLNPPWRTITLLLLVAVFFFGIAIAAILPPFEGPDETAHFSRLQSQAFVSQSSKTGTKEDSYARISTVVVDYYRHGPMPYEWIDFDFLHKNDPLRGYFTYGQFFGQSSRVESYVKTYRQSPMPAGYSPSPEPNWQYQHPALFYLVAGQITKAMAGHASLITTILVLRLFCYAMAFAGFCIGLRATWVQLTWMGSADAGAITALGAFYPFLAPEFCWEFARTGNDSMCLFLFGIMWALVLWHIRAPRSDAWLYLGFALGASLLVKALMFPVAAGILSFLFWYHFFVIRKDPKRPSGWWAGPFKVAALMLLIGAPTYLVGYLYGGNIGSGDFQNVLSADNIWSLMRQNVVLSEFMQDLLLTIQTAIWYFGSWSVLVIDIPMHRALSIFTAIILFLYIVRLRDKVGPLFVIPLWMALLMSIGLMAHILTTLIMKTPNITPGYYLHILGPAFALIYGGGLNMAISRWWSKVLMTALCGPVLALNFFIMWSYMAAYSGCIVPSLVDGTYRLSPVDIFRCAGQFDTVITHLRVLAWPDIALIAMGITFVLLTVASVLTLSAAPASIQE